MKEYAAKQPSPWVSVLPLAVLTLLLYVVIRCFGGDAINGGSQIALLSATSVCVMLAIGIYRCKWAVLARRFGGPHLLGSGLRLRQSSSCC